MFKKLSKTKVLFIIVGAFLVPAVVLAHCPLCTAGAGILAVVAASLGVPVIIITTLLGGFALAMGLWFAKIIKKKFIPYQYQVIAGLIYLSTVIPLWPVLKEYKILHAPFLGFGKYLNKIPVDLYIVGIVLGTIILWVSPFLSKKLSAVVGKQLIPFQGMIITFLLMILVPLLVNIFLLI